MHSNCGYVSLVFARATFGKHFYFSTLKVSCYWDVFVVKVTVHKEDGSSEVIQTKNILIATGSEVTPFAGAEVGINISFYSANHQAK